METAPNARVVTKTVSEDDEEHHALYQRAGGKLKIRFAAPRTGKWIDFNPSNLHVWFNGEEIDTLQSLDLVIDKSGVPTCTMKFTLEEVDIDTDSLMSLIVLAEGLSKEKDEEV